MSSSEQMPHHAPGPADQQDGCTVSTGSPAIGLFSGWMKDYGFLLPLGAVLGLVTLGQIAGADLWLVALSWLGALGGIISWIWHVAAVRMDAKEQDRKRCELLASSYLASADAMDGSEFERYIAALLAEDGHHDVRKVGGRGDGGVDILSRSPAGLPMAYQCKRYKDRVTVAVVRELIGSLGYEHQGRHGVIVTTAELTKDAKNLAQGAGIMVIDRHALASWMVQSRERIEQQQKARPTGHLSAWRFPGTTAAGLSAAAMTLAVLSLFQGAAPAPPQARADTFPASYEAGPAAVVKEHFAAINRHDWLTAWKMWVHAGPAHGSHYRKMIAGYQHTSRDVVMRVSVRGNNVAARVLAYETDGTVQTYEFHYKIRHGKIASGYSVLLKKVKGKGHGVRP